MRARVRLSPRFQVEGFHRRNLLTFFCALFCALFIGFCIGLTLRLACRLLSAELFEQAISSWRCSPSVAFVLATVTLRQLLRIVHLNANVTAVV